MKQRAIDSASAWVSTRYIAEVRLIPLHGTPVKCASVREAIAFVSAYGEEEKCEPLAKYEVQIRYNNGDKVDAQFNEKSSVIEFLEHYKSGNWTPVNEGEEDASSDLAE